MTISAVLYQAQSDDDRSAERVRVKLGAVWLDRELGAIELTVLDVSVSGFLVETEEPLPEKTSFIVELPDGICKSCRIVWSSGDFRGAVFSEPISDVELQNIILSSVERLSGLDRYTPQVTEYGKANQKDFEHEYGEVEDQNKLPFAARARIIFGSTAILWGMLGVLVWSTTAVMSG